MAHPNLMEKKPIIDVIKYRWIWLLISAILVVPCFIAIIYSMIVYDNHAPIKLGIDFTGGTILQYGVEENVTPEKITDLRAKLIEVGVDEPIIQTISSNANLRNKEESKKLANIVSIKTKFIDEKSNKLKTINKVMENELKDSHLISTSSVGPTLGKELLKNSLTAILLAFVGIVIYISLRFQFDYAIVALLALIHDAIFVIGSFSILSLVFNTQIDSLFITAVLTVIGFSVHDTIVIFDRIRENNRFLAKKYSFNEIVNASVNQTLARSINTSLTVLLTLFALYFFGGATTKEFVLAMIIGVAIGGYSSIFFASTLIAWYREKHAKAA